MSEKINVELKTTFTKEEFDLLIIIINSVISLIETTEKNKHKQILEKIEKMKKQILDNSFYF